MHSALGTQEVTARAATPMWLTSTPPLRNVL